MADNDRVRKLRWLCRRGMKELDILLERFVAQNHDALEQGAFPEFEALLQNEDDVLWDCLQNPESPSGSDFRSLLAVIRGSRA